MTQLTKPVKRQTSTLVRDGGKPRRLIVVLYPGDTIGLRQERCKREERTTLAAVYQLAVKMRVAAEKREKKARKP